MRSHSKAHSLLRVSLAKYLGHQIERLFFAIEIPKFEEHRVGFPVTASVLTLTVVGFVLKTKLKRAGFSGNDRS